MSISSLFEPEFVTQLCALFEERIRFNQLLGLRIDSLEADRASAPPVEGPPDQFIFA